MVRGFYAAASGLLTNSRKLNVTGENISNATTSGYKSDRVVSTSFSDALVLKMDKSAAESRAGIGNISNGQALSTVYTVYDQGNMKQTNYPYNFAIGGEGFFSVEMENGEVAYTRNGEFSLDNEGYLVTASGNRVLGENGQINTGGRDFEVTDDGAVMIDGLEIDRLAIHVPADYESMEKLTSGLFTDTAGETADFTGTIKQGYLEVSNADMSDQMMEMMTNQRGFQSCSQILKMIDQTLEKAETLASKR